MDEFDQEIRKRKEDISSLETARHTLTQAVKSLREESMQAERLAATRLRAVLNQVNEAKVDLEEAKAAAHEARIQIGAARQIEAQAQEALRSMAAREVEHRQVSEQAEAARRFLNEADDEIAAKERELVQVRQEVQLKSDVVRELREAEGEWLEEMQQQRTLMGERQAEVRHAEEVLAERQAVPDAEWEELREARSRLEGEQAELTQYVQTVEARERAAADCVTETQGLRIGLEEEVVRQGEWRDALQISATNLEQRITTQACLVAAAREAEVEAGQQLAGIGRREAALQARETLLDKKHQEQQALERELNERVEIIRQSSKALTARERQAADQTGA